MVIVAMALQRYLQRFFPVPYSILIPVIIMMAAIGAYALNNNTGDVALMAEPPASSIHVYCKLGYNSAALVLGLVLGQMCESNFKRAYADQRADPFHKTDYCRYCADLLYHNAGLSFIKPCLSKIKQKANR